MALRITKTNVSGFTGPFRETPTDPVEAADYLNPAYEAVDSFSIDLVFEGEYEVTAAGTPEAPGEVTFVYANAIDVTCTFDWASIGVVYSKPSPHIVRLVGPAETVFTNQFYKFALTNYTEQILPPDTTQPFWSLTHYQMPVPTYTKKTYPFTAIIPKETTVLDPLAGGGGYEAGPYYDGSGNLILSKVQTVQKDMFQWFYWRYQVAVANIASIKARGLK